MNKIARSIGILSVLFLMAVASTPATGSTKLPEGVMGYAWVSNPELMLSDADKFMQELDIPPMASMIIKMALGGMLENPNLTGVDMTAPLCLANFSIDQPEAWAINFTLSNPASYLKTIKKSLKVKSEDTASGITIYSKEVEEFDDEAFNAASSEEQEDMSKFYRTVETTIAIAIKGKSAWISLDPDSLKKIHNISTAELKPQLDNNLVIVLQIQPLLDYVEPLIREGLEDLEIPEGENSSPLGDDAAKKMLSAYVDLYLYYARQVSTTALGFTLNGKGVELAKWVEPKKGSPLEEFLSAQKKGTLSLSRYLEPEPWMVIDGKMQKQEMLIELYRKFFDLFGVVLEEIDTEKNGKKTIDLAKLEETFIKNIQDYLKCSGDEMAFSISSSPDAIFSAVAVQKITDPELYRNYITKSYLESINDLLPLYEKFGISFDLTGIKAPEKYKGIEIFTVGIEFDFEKLLPKEEKSDDEKRALALFDSPMTIQMAATDKLAVTEMAWGKRPDIKARLDLISTGKSSFNLKELGTCRENANGVVLFSVNRYLKDMISEMMKKMAPEEVGTPQADMMDKLGNLDLPLLICFGVEDGNMKVNTSISMDKILAVKTLIEEMDQPPAPAEPEPASQE